MAINKKKAICLVVDQGFSVRYLLRSDIYKVLLNSGHPIVILTPNADEDYFRREFESENVSVHRYRVDRYEIHYRKSLLHRFMRTVSLFVYPKGRQTNHARFWYERFVDDLRGRGPAAIPLRVLFPFLIRCLCAWRLLRRALRWTEFRWAPVEHGTLFDEYEVGLLVVTSLGNLSYDLFIMAEAKKRGVRIASLILSWDNPTTKGSARLVPDFVVAWSETMKRELVDFHEIPEDRIHVGGVVQYDTYFRPERLQEKGDLFERFGLNPELRLIFFCLMSPTQFPWNPRLIEMMGRLVEEGAFYSPVQVLFRLHPIYFRVKNGKSVFKEELDRIRSLEKAHAHLHFDFPGNLSRAISYDMPAEEAVKLGSTLRHADVLLCFFSSMMIEASIFDTPVVNVALYEKNRIPTRVIERHEHLKRILRTGGVRIAYTEKELVHEINAYLQSPERDREGRRRIVEQEAGPNRGVAGRSIAEYLLKIVQ